MPFINYAAREITCKLVYYGPGLGGKTTNLQWIYQNTQREAKGKMVTLATESERTLFFDLLPLSLGKIRGFSTRFQLYTVPGQIFYDASRKLILKGADGVAFVADSQAARFEANIESLRNLKLNLEENGLDFETIPYVLQLNKRDLPTALPVDQLVTALRCRNEPVFEAVAPQGIGVVETLKALVKQSLSRLKAGTPATTHA
ncbi:MAG: GTPase domain-containing protein [Acidobacteriota bacterium]|nr:GTPase domain-containing protein [Acidobacteriota bacterium]MDQ7088396.1 GTPase domain-containing protein [Acidobacteriota bacterium]